MIGVFYLDPIKNCFTLLHIMIGVVYVVGSIRYKKIQFINLMFRYCILKTILLIMMLIHEIISVTQLFVVVYLFIDSKNHNYDSVFSHNDSVIPDNDSPICLPLFFSCL